MPSSLARVARVSVATIVVALAASRWWSPTDPRTVALRWREPAACTERYRVEAATFVRGERRAASTWTLTIAALDGRAEARMVAIAGDDERRAAAQVRELWIEAGGVGPAAPDLACRVELGDPVEDALAFAWPALPAGEVAIGDAWTGRAVAGRCHAWACADAEGRLRRDDPSCRAGPWRERLLSAGPSRALVRGRWQLGGDPGSSGAAILTSRLVLIADGRPLRAILAVDSQVSDARLELELERIDDCPAPPEPSALARVRERVRARLWDPAGRRGKTRRPHT